MQCHNSVEDVTYHIKSLRICVKNVSNTTRDALAYFVEIFALGYDKTHSFQLIAITVIEDVGMHVSPLCTYQVGAGELLQYMFTLGHALHSMAAQLSIHFSSRSNIHGWMVWTVRDCYQDSLEEQKVPSPPLERLLEFMEALSIRVWQEE